MSKRYTVKPKDYDCLHYECWSEAKPRNHFVPWRACINCGGSIAPWVGVYGNAPPSQLTYPLALEICADIRAGAYPWVAATKHVDYDTFRYWRSQRSSAYRVFNRMVDRASAEARLEAEMIAKATDPKWWLKHGPGRKAPTELPDEGWGDEKKQIEITGQVNHAHAHIHAKILEGLSSDELRLLDKVLSAAGQIDTSEAAPVRLLPASVADSGAGDPTD